MWLNRPQRWEGAGPPSRGEGGRGGGSNANFKLCTVTLQRCQAK